MPKAPVPVGQPKWNNHNLICFWNDLVWFGLVLWHINCRLFNAKSCYYIIHFVDNILKWAWAFFCTQLNGFRYCYITVTIQHQSFVCTQFSSIWSIDRTLLGATTLGQSGPGSHSNEGVLHILQISKAGASPSDGLMSYPGHSLMGEGSYSSAEMQSVCSKASAKWAISEMSEQLGTVGTMNNLRVGWKVDIIMMLYLLLINFWPMGSKHCNTDWRSVWTAKGAMLKNKFHESILVNLWTFQLTLISKA